MSQPADYDEEHDRLAGDMLSLTSLMRRNFTIAGNVIREDNKTLGAMQTVAEGNRDNLGRESKRLEHHAGRSCFECTMLIVIMLVMWSFIAMIIVMRIFPKREL